MNDTELVGTWSALEPSSHRRARIEERVFEWLEAGETSLAGEWFGLLKVEPLKGLAYVSVGGLAMALFSPAYISVGVLTLAFLSPDVLVFTWP